MAGKSAKYGKPEDMQKRIDEYFKPFDEAQPLTDKKGAVLLDKQGNPVFKESKPTSSGLAYFLGFSSRSSLWEYEQKPTFSRVIRRAKLRLATFWEPELLGKNSNGAEFWLLNQNDGWQNKKQMEDISGNNEPRAALVVFVNARGELPQAVTMEKSGGAVIDMGKTEKSGGVVIDAEVIKEE